MTCVGAQQQQFLLYLTQMFPLSSAYPYSISPFPQGALKKLKHTVSHSELLLASVSKCSSLWIAVVLEKGGENVYIATE